MQNVPANACLLLSFARLTFEALFRGLTLNVLREADQPQSESDFHRLSQILRLIFVFLQAPNQGFLMAGFNYFTRFAAGVL